MDEGTREELWPFIAWVGRIELVFFLITKGVLNFYRYILWVFLTGLKAYLLQQIT